MNDPKDDLIELCAAMRAAQICYFTGGRTSVARDEAIRLERQWDRLYKRYVKLGGQMEMFGPEEVVTRPGTSPGVLPGQRELFGPDEEVSR